MRDAFVGAVNEALSNVERHSGQRSVTVSGFLGRVARGSSSRTPGSGFDPATTGPGIGLRTSVRGGSRRSVASSRCGPGLATGPRSC